MRILRVESARRMRRNIRASRIDGRAVPSACSMAERLRLADHGRAL